MDDDQPAGPDRREFMKRVGGAAIYGVPVVAVLGAARPLAGSRPRSNPEQIARHFEQAATHLTSAYRLGDEYRFSEEDWEVLAPAIKKLQGPIKAYPPRWCERC